MLKFTGPLNGEIVENKIISANELQKAFDLKVNENTYFRMTGIKQTEFGERRPEGVRFQPVISGFLNGEHYVIRYYKIERPRQGQETKYTPERLILDEKEKGYSVKEDKELVVFMMLSPACEQSPFRTAKSVTLYSIVDIEALTKVSLEKEIATVDLTNQILTETNGVKLMSIAKGIEIMNEKIQSHLTMSADAAKVQLALLQKKYPEQFAAAYTDFITEARGYARYLVDEKKVILVDGVWKTQNGKKVVEGIDEIENYVIDNFEAVQKMFKTKE